MNVRPKHYGWRKFYDHVIDLVGYSFSWRVILRRFQASTGVFPRGMNALRAVSTEGFGRLRYYREIRRRLDTDRRFRPYFEQETTELPRFYLDLVREDLGRLWDWLPQGALFHDPYAYLKCRGGLPDTSGGIVPPVAVNSAATEDGTLQAEQAATVGGEPGASSRGWPVAALVNDLQVRDDTANNATHAQRKKRVKHDEVGAEENAEAATNQEQAAAAPEADPKAMEVGVKRSQV